MATYTLQDLSTILRRIGRGVVFSGPVYSPGTALTLTHLGDTEGDIVVNTNAEIATLTTPELTGAAAHEADYVGENPVIEIPMYLSDPALRAKLSPSGQSHAGRSRRSVPIEHTLSILPEALFTAIDPGTGASSVDTISVSAAGVWSRGATTFSAAQSAILAAGAFWAWRGIFSRPPMTYRGGAGDDSKDIDTASFQLMFHPGMPEDHHLYTIGDPTLFGIDLEIV